MKLNQHNSNTIQLLTKILPNMTSKCRGSSWEGDKEAAIANQGLAVKHKRMVEALVVFSRQRISAYVCRCLFWNLANLLLVVSYSKFMDLANLQLYVCVIIFRM